MFFILYKCINICSKIINNYWNYINVYSFMYTHFQNVNKILKNNFISLIIFVLTSFGKALFIAIQCSKYFYISFNVVHWLKMHEKNQSNISPSKCPSLILHLSSITYIELLEVEGWAHWIGYVIQVFFLWINLHLLSLYWWIILAFS